MTLSFRNNNDVTMSKYEDYDDISNSYDNNRQPEGADIIAGLLHIHGGKSFKVRIDCTLQYHLYGIRVSLSILHAHTHGTHAKWHVRTHARKQ